MKNSKLNIKNIILIVVILILMGVIIFFVGRSYGFFQYIKEGETVNVVTIKGIRVTVDSGSDSLNISNAEPLYDSDGLNSTPFTFTFTNTSSRPISYTIRVVNDTDKQSACLINEGEANEAVCPELSTSNIRFSYKLNNGEYSLPANLGSNNNVVATYTINGGESLTYSLKMWIKSDATNEIQGSYFFGQLLIQGTAASEERND